MRTILFFDLPAITKSDHRQYRKFVKFIKKLGFVMYQESVYTKISLSESAVESALKEVKSNLPKDGKISALTITEKQFASITQLLGKSSTDVVISDEKMIKL